MLKSGDFIIFIKPLEKWFVACVIFFLNPRQIHFDSKWTSQCICSNENLLLELQLVVERVPEIRFSGITINTGKSNKAFLYFFQIFAIFEDFSL